MNGLEALKSMFEAQKIMVQLFDHVPLKTKTFRYYILALIVEAIEALSLIPWKEHKFDEDIPRNIQVKLLEELVDIQKFLITLVILSDHNADEFYAMFKEKTAIVMNRFKEAGFFDFGTL